MKQPLCGAPLMFRRKRCYHGFSLTSYQLYAERVSGQGFRFHLFLQGFDSPEIVHRRCCLQGAVRPCGRGRNLFSEAVEQFSLPHFDTPTPWSRDAAGSLEHRLNQRARMCARGKQKPRESFIHYIHTVEYYFSCSKECHKYMCSPVKCETKLSEKKNQVAEHDEA